MHDNLVSDLKKVFEAGMFSGADDAELGRRKEERTKQSKDIVALFKEDHANWDDEDFYDNADCPVCHTEVLNDYYDSDEDVTWREERFECETCGTDFSLYYTIETEYDKTRINSLPD